MGWWWSSKPSSSSDNSIKTSQPDNLLEGQSPSTISVHESPPARQLTREEQADAELRGFLKSLESSITPPSTTTSSSTTTSRLQASKSTRDDTIQQQQQQQEQNTSNSIAPDSLYPDTMSCRSAFDYAFFCQSFGGQWVNVYRYGELRSCSEHWENFWLCMKARGVKDDDTRKEMIRNHYRKKAVKYKTGPSSEDVWEVRLEPLKGAFQGDFEKLEREQ